MGRRKKTSSRSLSESEHRAIKILQECSIDTTGDLSVLSDDQAKYLLGNPRVFTEIFQDNSSGK